MQLGVIPIPKASRREHAEENAQVFDFELDADDMGTLNRLA
jgi:diketogulonate reductase-like aldo/keto reductase